MGVVILLASARGNGNTAYLSKQLGAKVSGDVIDLKEFNVLPYNYDGEYKDDFLDIINKLIINYDTIIFATPVYWYAMSGILKTFFDRLTDLITTHKNLGRKLEGKKVLVVTTSSGDNLGDNFWLPFRKTSEYLNMSFIGAKHFDPIQDLERQMESFITDYKLINRKG